MSAQNNSLPANDNGADAGLYTWDLDANALYADSALAHLFGLDWRKTERGLPIQTYLARIYADDRQRIAKAISEAISSRQPFQECYRVVSADGALVRITAFGKCFSDANGNPKHYSGIVFPMPEEVQPDSDLRWLCLAAFDIAKRDKRSDVAMILREALAELGCVSLFPHCI